MIKAGYKKTEVGEIPEDWEIKAVEDISDVRSGKRLPLGNSLTDKETPYPYIRVVDMEIGTIVLDDIKYIPPDVFPCIKNYRIFEEDIFISVAGSLGIVGKIPSQLDGANLTENADRLTKISVDRDYLMYMLMSPLIQNTIESEKTLGAQPKLALTRIRQFNIPLPPTKIEQTAIAMALSDTVALIQSLSQLIAKKRQIKQGAMQQLFNPYNEGGELKSGWVVKRLVDVLKIGHGKSQHEVINSNGQYPILASGGEIGRATKFLYNKPSVLIGRKGTIDVPQYMDEPFWTIDTLFYSEILEPNNPKYIFYQFCLIDWYSYNEASGVPSLSARTIENIEISIPIAGEQTQIAKTLTDMDTEITTLETKRTKYQQIKQGMMQNLLTGRIRLI